MSFTGWKPVIRLTWIVTGGLVENLMARATNFNEYNFNGHNFTISTDRNVRCTLGLITAAKMAGVFRECPVCFQDMRRITEI
ncbi:MAG TPA: hypothetical protein VK982_05085 [Bacteroidales bacterium]|nr:hypothetical protein [Bacteroidales bacterium]